MERFPDCWPILVTKRNLALVKNVRSFWQPRPWRIAADVTNAVRQICKGAFYGVAAIRQSSARNHRLVLIKEGRFSNRPLRNSGLENRSLLDSKLRLLGK